MSDTDTDDHDDALREWARQLFGRHQPTIDLSQPAERRANIVPREGNNPGPVRISDEAYRRDFVRRLFNPDYAATEPPIDGAAPPPILSA